MKQIKNTHCHGHNDKKLGYTQHKYISQTHIIPIKQTSKKPKYIHVHKDTHTIPTYRDTQTYTQNLKHKYTPNI